MMNYQPQHFQKREIGDIQKMKYKYKSNKKNLEPFNLIKKYPCTKIAVIVEQS